MEDTKDKSKKYKRKKLQFSKTVGIFLPTVYANMGKFLRG